MIISWRDQKCSYDYKLGDQKCSYDYKLEGPEVFLSL